MHTDVHETKMTSCKHCMIGSDWTRVRVRVSVSCIHLVRSDPRPVSNKLVSYPTVVEIHQ